jgi:hypothetical protein
MKWIKNLMSKENDYTVQLWLKDMGIVYQNPNDTDFINKVAKKVNKSSSAVKYEIMEIIESNHLIEKDPVKLMHILLVKDPRCFGIYKSEEDPWFVI